MATGTGLPPHLIEYWSRTGEGGAKIQWGVDGDFHRCTLLINEAIVNGGKPPLSTHVIDGLCSTLHVLNTGARPGHAPGESKA